MPGTGKHGYTGASLYGGSYNISNGIVQSGSAAKNTGVVNRNSPYGRDLSGSSSNRVNNAASRAIVDNAISSGMDLSGFASGVANMASHSNSDYGDMIRELISQNQSNTAQSQAFAREQMDYQTRSDQAAMAWSAAEAQKNRDWQERLSDTAHQREVKDLAAAGLNPVLSANQGAYTGSGATGQGFSSSGAMGQVDTSATNAIGSLLSTIISSAANAHIADMYVDAERYASDLQYSSSRLATEAGIMNNQNTTSAQKEIAYAGFANDLAKTELAGQYGLQNTALSNAGALDRTVYSESAANGRQMNSDIAANYRTNQTNASNERQTESKNASGSLLSAGPYRALIKGSSELIERARGKYDADAKKFLNKSNGRTSSSSEYASKLLRDIGWG